MGPEGGSGGGTVVAEGTPEQVAAVPASHTGRFLKDVLAGRGRGTASPKAATKATAPAKRAPAKKAPAKAAARVAKAPGRGKVAAGG
jgi:excinuclease ABC subunit A